MNTLSVLLCLITINCGLSQTADRNINLLLKHYPQIIKYENNKLHFNDGTYLIYDDGISKNEDQLLNNADIEDQFHFVYTNSGQPKKDAGRIRNEAFFKKIYGLNKKEVHEKLVDVIWCPKLVNIKFKITQVNNINKKVEKLSEELDEHPEYKKYLENIGGTFMWRKISGTNRLSNHSFGTAIDINVKYSHYWQWDCKCKDEHMMLNFNNSIPEGLVRIFEKHGFIWGGRWYHYDTMHFEYRPELLEKLD